MSEEWVEIYRPQTDATLRLFCFPHAGGGAALYRLWPSQLPSHVELCAVELPGRGRRFGEAAFSRLPELMEAMGPALLPFMDKPFAFFGHSMGGILSFELARFLRRRGALLPQRIIAAGCGAPHTKLSQRRNLHQLPDDLFLKELETLKGTPPEVLKHRELMQLFLPLLRADLSVVETYQYEKEAPLDIPLHVLGGEQDEEVLPSALQAWREHTTAEFSLNMLPGDHFFLKSAQSQLLEVLLQVL
ncbi:MAG: alpha/beta fold hydrolase [bacterium]